MSNDKEWLDSSARELSPLWIARIPGGGLFVMKKNVPFDPAEICSLSPQAEMSKASHIAYLFEKFTFRDCEASYR